MRNPMMRAATEYVPAALSAWTSERVRKRAGDEQLTVTLEDHLDGGEWLSGGAVGN